MATREALRGEATTVLASTARTASPTADTFRVVGGADALIVIIDVTLDEESASVVFTLKGVDPVSGATWDVLASAAVTAVGTTVLRVSPHLTASANAIAKDIAPAYFTVAAVHADTDAMTYSVAVQAV